ncbi:alpha/beta hydrolase family protein [Paenibacillus mendelii]|uniref:Alpha/beta hydrolase family protein n=1 Tax=Paenibacillus mendelii TaxID=206163 RepID=A0ABV6J7H3_9BACL|nr:acetylxylan esterase [Paenibacillus mendelii]MCQ6562140.1 acetylxylan esterase [Paenibacillus mendelii]
MSSQQFFGPWDMESLIKAPAVQWETIEHYPTYTLKQLYYENEQYNGESTRVFAYYAVPLEAAEPLPAMVLVHGGAGKAFPEWAGQWAERGYASIAMDLFGNGPSGERMSDGGPSQTDNSLFLELAADSLTRMWSYHAVAAVIRAISLLSSQPEVDGSRIGLMGISWGGYLSEIVSGLDSRPAFAMTAYAAGYYRQGSCWMDILSTLDESQQKLWDQTFDIVPYIGQSTMPMLWATWTNDPCFYLDNWAMTYRQAQGQATLRLLKDWDHNYEVPWGTREFFIYADSHVNGGRSLPRIRSTGEDQMTAWAEFEKGERIRKATFLHTADNGSSPSRRWEETPAELDPASCLVSSRIPADTTMYCFNLEDEFGHIISTDLIML